MKYIKDEGHAVIDRTDADNIINTATTKGIYNLTLGQSDKERMMLVAGKAHKASAITFAEAKEGAMEAHNFSLQALITTIHTQNKKKQDAKSVARQEPLLNWHLALGHPHQRSRRTIWTRAKKRTTVKQKARSRQ